MQVIAEVSVVPIGVGVSLSRYVAAAITELESAGFHCHVQAYGTVIEGEYDTVFAAVRRAVEKVQELGVPRVHCSVKFGCRTDKDQSVADRLASIEAQRP
ncbi:MAG: MTH1187 family thiamine-binding protein [Planctomycetota bacterium]